MVCTAVDLKDVIGIFLLENKPVVEEKSSTTFRSKSDFRKMFDFEPQPVRSKTSTNNKEIQISRKASLAKQIGLVFQKPDPNQLSKPKVTQEMINMRKRQVQALTEAEGKEKSMIERRSRTVADENSQEPSGQAALFKKRKGKAAAFNIDLDSEQTREKLAKREKQILTAVISNDI